MKCCFTYLCAVCRALLQKNSRVFIVTNNEKNVRPTVYFKNGSYIKIVVQDSTEDNYRGKRANIIEWYDCDTLSKEEIDEVLNNLKVYFY